jgi:serine/threonine-protein kinase HipA
MDESSLVQLDDLYRIAKQILSEKSSFSENLDEHYLADLIKVGTSPGGKHPKAIIAIQEKTGEVRSGQSEVPEGFEHWLLKFDMDHSFPQGRVEYAYYRMAIDAKIEMSTSLLKEEKGRAHFLTKRFDRINNDKIHLQTLAALSPVSTNYNDIFKTMRRLKLTYSEQEQLFRRMVFNVVARNIDDHSKNFSFLMQQDGSWRLSPAYDLTFTYTPTDPSFMNRHEFSINGKSDDLTRKDLLLTAADNEMGEADKIIDEVVDIVSNWKHYATIANIGKQTTRLIEDSLLLL